MYDPVWYHLSDALDHLKDALDIMYGKGDGDIRIRKTLYAMSIIEKILKIKKT